VYVSGKQYSLNSSAEAVAAVLSFTAFVYMGLGLLCLAQFALHIELLLGPPATNSSTKSHYNSIEWAEEF
jgi:hypothetical protein